VASTLDANQSPLLCDEIPPVLRLDRHVVQYVFAEVVSGMTPMEPLPDQVLPNATVRACQVSFQLTGWLFVVGITLAEGQQIYFADAVCCDNRDPQSSSPLELGQSGAGTGD
jgi:hypothetical protein